MQWNLNDHLSVAGGRRAFFLPLASIPPENTTIRVVDQDAFSLSESRIDFPASDPEGVTTDYTLSINITEPAGGFIDEGFLPDPLIRMHAMGKGLLRFRPSGSFDFDALELELLNFNLTSSSKFPKWWKRWEEAGTIPHKVIYENVDADQLRTLLESLIPGPNQQNGLQFPFNLTDSDKANYIDEFLLSNNTLFAEAGSFIGTAASNQSGTPSSDSRMLILHSTYHGHSDTDPHPMNPRELFALLFGDDSSESFSHPLLLKMHETGQAETKEPRTRRMIIRPPLRTSKRVEWEAGLEKTHHGAEWSSSNNLDKERVFNTHQRNGRFFNRIGYDGFKCNVFADDITLRAGFRNCVHPVGKEVDPIKKFKYMNANSHANFVTLATGTKDRIPLKGQKEDDTVVWAWKIEHLIRSKAEAERQNALNEAIQIEGRCLVIAGARPRRFKTHEVTSDITGISDCKTALQKKRSGHIVIVKEIKDQPQMAGTEGHGLNKIKVDTFEAIRGGVDFRTDLLFKLGGRAASASSAKGFISLHIFELHPGKDPDTLQGLRDLNVFNFHKDKIGNADEKAANRALTHKTDGSVRTDGLCCKDNFPPRDAEPTEVSC